MSVGKSLLLASLSCLCIQPLAAQNVQLRGLPNAGTLPSAEQMLNQNLNNQKNNFSTRTQIDQANRLNRTEQINRLNAKRENFANPCAGPGAPCEIQKR